MQRHRRYYRPQLEVLEDRLPPGGLSGIAGLAGRNDEDALLLALGSLAAATTQG